MILFLVGWPVAAGILLWTLAVMIGADEDLWRKRR